MFYFLIIFLFLIILLPLLIFTVKLNTEKKIYNKNIKEKEDEIKLTKEQLEKEKNNFNLLKQEVVKLEVKLEEKEKNELKLKEELEKIGNKIVENSREKIKSESLENINSIINPFKEKLKDITEKIEKDNKEKVEFKSAFETQVKVMQSNILNSSEETKKLREALTKNPKIRGNWGEGILESILDSLGLKEGLNYKKQISAKSEDDKNQRPDIIVYHKNTNIIIDSKLSLVNYLNYNDAETEDQRQSYEKILLQDVRNHINELAEKKYNKAKFEDDNFVIENIIMFIPMEPVFYLIMQNSKENLYNYALEKGIYLAGPYNLTAMLQTIVSVIKIENNAKYTKEAANLIEKIYSKIAVFINDIIGISNDFNKYHTSIDGKLQTTIKRITQEVIKKDLRKLKNYDFGKEELEIDLDKYLEIEEGENN